MKVKTCNIVLRSKIAPILLFAYVGSKLRKRPLAEKYTILGLCITKRSKSEMEVVFGLWPIRDNQTYDGTNDI